jgi:hypothetical protein
VRRRPFAGRSIAVTISHPAADEMSVAEVAPRNLVAGDTDGPACRLHQFSNLDRARQAFLLRSEVLVCLCCFRASGIPQTPVVRAERSLESVARNAIANAKSLFRLQTRPVSKKNQKKIKIFFKRLVDDVRDQTKPFVVGVGSGSRAVRQNSRVRFFVRLPLHQGMDQTESCVRNA